MLRRFRCNYRGCLIVFNVLKAAWLRHFPCCAYIDGAVAAVVAAAKKVLYTGKYGDGKIFIYDVENVVKIRTGEEGYEALQDEPIEA